MKQRTTLTLALLLVGIAIAARVVIALAAGSATAQTDADQQATIDALVNQRFTETAIAAASATPDSTQQAQMTLAFQQTVDAAFALALTASALPPGQPTAMSGEGGTQVVLVAQRDLTMEETHAAAQVMVKRLEMAGIADPLVTVQAPGRIVAAFASGSNPERIIRLISRQGLLQFLDYRGLDEENPAYDEGTLLRTDENPDAEGINNSDTRAPFVTIASSRDIIAAEAAESDDEWIVNYTFNDDAVNRVRDYIGDEDRRTLGVTLDGEVLATVRVNRERNFRDGRIDGDFNQRQARDLQTVLRSGLLPVGFAVESTAAVAVPPTPTPTASPTVTPTFTPSPSPTFDPFPTVTAGEVQVAEQVFEHGRMMWVQPVRQIWVMVVDPDDEDQGEWQVYEDTFKEGEAEFDPSIVPPEGMYQPERGFGKLWRENDAVREALGWGITPEFGYVSRYEYHPGGEVDANLTYTPAPGFHVLFALDGAAFRFNEDDGTWQTLDADDDDD